MFFFPTYFLGILAQLLAIFEFDIQASQKGFFVTEVNDMFASVIFLKKKSFGLRFSKARRACLKAFFNKGRRACLMSFSLG